MAKLTREKKTLSNTNLIIFLRKEISATIPRLSMASENLFITMALEKALLKVYFSDGVLFAQV
jgi:hypothetical protein